MRADARARREALIEAAITLFISQGEDVALETVADEANVGIATLYRHFPDRLALIRACAIRLGKEFSEFQESCLRRIDSEQTSPEDVLNTYARRLIDMGLPSLISAFASEATTQLPAELETLRQTIADNGRALMNRLHERNCVDPNVTHLELVSGVMALSRPRHVNLNDMQPGIDSRLIELFLRGLRDR